MRSLIQRSIVVALVLISCVLLVMPNFMSQSLVIVFKEYTRGPDGKKVPANVSEISDFIRDRENGLGLYFPNAVCKPQADKVFPAERRCILEDKYITAARINEMSQAHPDLIDEFHTRVLPHGIERALKFLSEGDAKHLKIRMGLDLQGGMRATFRADFDKHLASLKERYTPLINDIEAKLALPTTSPEEKKNLTGRLESYKEQLTISEQRKLELLQEAKKIIDARLASQNLTEPELRVQPGSYSIGVDLPGMANSSEVLAKIRDTVTVEYRIVNDEATNRLGSFEPEIREIQNMYTEQRVDNEEIKAILARVTLKAGIKPEEGKVFLRWRRGLKPGSASLPRSFVVLGPLQLDGSDMTSANANHGQSSSYYEISFVLTAEGASKFADLTTKNVGKQIAIVWGDRVVSSANIREPIVGGVGQITGDFSQADAQDIADVIREGALPLNLEILSVSFVGPSLGQESIFAGIVSLILSFILVIIFMVGYYRMSGLVAVTALLLNLLIMTAVLSFLEFTLTLPGFAGAILTVGMAVDANVIIYEKMKEDVREGKTASLAVADGFDSSLWTIVDSHVTTIISAVILGLVGDGPIKGFAIVLFFGLITSMFTSLYVSHLIFDWALHLLHFEKLSVGWGMHPKGAQK
ncbi:MAG: protein translocase subunit SecD [Spirochaetia bacterium]|nr:protein translocase subunit SecD [Spirochaetia bacterium]